MTQKERKLQKERERERCLIDTGSEDRARRRKRMKKE